MTRRRSTNFVLRRFLARDLFDRKVSSQTHIGFEKPSDISPRLPPKYRATSYDKFVIRKSTWRMYFTKRLEPPRLHRRTAPNVARNAVAHLQRLQMSFLTPLIWRC